MPCHIQEPAELWEQVLPWAWQVLGLVLLSGTNLCCAWADPATQGNPAGQDLGKRSPQGNCPLWAAARDLSLMPSSHSLLLVGTSRHTSPPKRQKDKCLSSGFHLVFPIDRSSNSMCDHSVTLWRALVELLLCFKSKKQMPDLNSSLSFCRDRQGRQSPSGSEGLTAPGRSDSLQALPSSPLPQWRFIAPQHCHPSHNGKLRHGNTNFSGTPISLKEGLGSTPGSISHLPATVLQNITSNHHPIHGESGTAFCNFPGDVAGIKVLKGKLAPFLNHTNLLFLW